MGKDIDEVIRTIEKTQIADADDKVLYLFAHDYNARGIIETFPAGTANGWKKGGWRESMLWRFIADFAEALKEVTKGQGIGDGQEGEESKL